MSLVNSNPLILAAGGDYQISRSVRLRSSATGYFSRTFAGAPTSTTRQTFSFWVKRGLLGSSQYTLFGGYDGSSVSSFSLSFNADNLVLNFGGSAANLLTTTAVYRDPSSWYHIVLAIDTTQATSSNRELLYVNGVQVTAFSTANYPAQNANIQFALANVNNRVGSVFNNSSPTDGYLTEFNFIDGQQLTPSSFGETNPITGVWQPKKYTGTYGTNGFFLNFSDPSAGATGIGKDSSGNGNNWTPNNVSLTAGSTYDSMLDVPTLWADGGNGRGNYAVLNPVFKNANATYGVMATPSDGNLNATMGAGTNVYSTIALPTSGKYYVECEAVSFVSQLNIGFMSDDGNANRSAWWNNANGIYVDNVQQFSGATSTGVIAMAIDCDLKTVQFYRDNSARGSAYTYSTGSVAAHLLWAYTNSGATVRWNFGQRPFTYTPPTGFKALNTQNLPEPVIKKGNQYFDVVTYTGNAVQDRSVTGFGFDLDLAWIKSRSNAGSHVLVNRVVGGNKQLFSNLTDAEQTNIDVTNGFTTGGIVLGDNVSGTGSTNQNAYTYVLWGWKEGATPGLDIVAFTSTGTSMTVSHNLGVTPNFVILKRRDSADNWFVNSSAFSTRVGNYLVLNSTAAIASSATTFTGFSSSTVSFGAGLMLNGATYDTYLFAAIAGFSAFGSYTGNGSADGPFVFCGFRPRWVLIKAASAAGTWTLWDSARSTANSTNLTLAPNNSNAENTVINIDLLSNGFKLRHVGDINTSGDSIIYAAFAENPFKYALAR
jgi:hypothetical protein